MNSEAQRLLEPLTHAVQFRARGGGGGEWWETIAAFDTEKVAESYARECSQNNPSQLYRVVPLGEKS